MRFTLQLVARPSSPELKAALTAALWASKGMPLDDINVLMDALYKPEARFEPLKQQVVKTARWRP